MQGCTKLGVDFVITWSFILPTCFRFSGNFKHDQFHGYGELRYVDGSIYKGEFDYGDRCGYGVYTVPGGLSYEGQWTHNVKDGRGKMTYENGDVYDGTWMDDMVCKATLFVHVFRKVELLTRMKFCYINRKNTILWGSFMKCHNFHSV